MKRASVAHIHAVAKDRKPGYIEACQRAGKLSQDGQWLIFPDDVHAALRKEFNPQRAKRGLGDLLHSVVGPIGRAVRWPCMKGKDSTDLKPGSPCDHARRALNTIKI
jgi:hypothetical protein